MNARLTVLLLAGSRGPDDPVARAAGVASKALTPVAGRPMVERVVETLQRERRIGRIVLVADERPGSQDSFRQLSKRAGVELMSQSRSPASTVAEAMTRLGDDCYPLLVATADHPLLDARMIATLIESSPADADIAIALADAETVLSAYPDAVRTVLRLGGKGYCGCNLFLMRGPAAVGAVRYWQRLESFRKKPWRLVAAAGVPTLVRYLSGRLDLEGAFSRLSRLSGATIRPVLLSQPEAAIDVDKPEDLMLVERILAARVPPPSV